jgi:hypothetical protein
MEEEHEITEVKKPQKKKASIIDLINDSPPATKSTNSNKAHVKLEKPTATPKSEMMIADLYERMHRFRILCRINFMSHFTSQKGNPCTKLMLIDERGDEILCIVYDKALGMF